MTLNWRWPPNKVTVKFTGVHDVISVFFSLQQAPVVARATLLLECAHFVNRCNHGDWPNWMKLNLPGFRQTGLLHSRGQPSGYRRNLMLQRAAGRMFHMWGEVGTGSK